MSITSDLRNYADNLTTAADSLADKAGETVNDLRHSAEKAINVDALRSAVEPYLAQAREYGTSVTDRAEELINTLATDPRFAKLFETANSVSTVVLTEVHDRVVVPVRSLAGLNSRPTRPAARKAPKTATTRPASRTSSGRTTGQRSTAAKSTGASSRPTTRPASKSTAATSTASKATASRSTASKAATKSTASRSTASKSAATKSTARKATPRPSAGTSTTTPTTATPTTASSNGASPTTQA